MAEADTVGDAVPMTLGTITRPGDLTRAGYERSLDERLHQQLALLIMRRLETGERVRKERQDGRRDLADNPDLIEALDDEALLSRRITLLQTWLARPHR
jgi:hypothetical protein